MKLDHLKLLVCPKCKVQLELTERKVVDGDRLREGELGCPTCKGKYPVTKSIPRFVPLENYASGFGLEWTKHARTQYDSHSGSKISETRFFNETKWGRDLPGEFLLEVGSGSGRFTEQALKTGATVVSMDYSYAVDANYSSNGTHDNLLVVQGDIYQMPFREGFFDKVLCIGVLQHTPDPERSFMTLPRYLKAGGRLTVDVYKRNDSLKGRIGRLIPSKYMVRPFVRGWPPEVLYRRVTKYINFMWPIARVINKIPKFGRWLNWRLVIADYRGVFDLSEEMLKEWAILDTFDMLSPVYDFPQTLETLRSWFEKAGMQEVEVHYGYNGVEGRGRKQG